MGVLLLAAVALLSLLVVYKLWAWSQSRRTVPALHSRYVFVTGCDTGFGRRLALRLDGMGCHVFAACLTPSAASQLAAETSERVRTLIVDVTRDEDIERAVREVTAALPEGKGLWGVVNNAGIMGPCGAAEMMTRQHFLAPLQVNLLGLTQVCRLFLPLLRAEGGRLVNTASVVSKFALSPAPYVASKFAALGFTDMLRRELYYHNVTVHAVLPGVYATPLLDRETTLKSLTSVFQAAPPEVRQVYGRDYVEKTMQNVDLMTRMVASSDPEEVVDAYVHALTSRRPRLYYVVGRNGNYVFRPLWMLPTRLADWIVARGVTRPHRD